MHAQGGPSLGFCGGRVDDDDGTDSLPLGPSALQQAIAPCDVNGRCDAPLGPTTVGLIYVNPEGPMGNPDPVASAAEVSTEVHRGGGGWRQRTQTGHTHTGSSQPARGARQLSGDVLQWP